MELFNLIRHLPDDSPYGRARGVIPVEAIQLILTHGVLDVLIQTATGGKVSAPTLEEILRPADAEPAELARPRTFADWVTALGPMIGGVAAKGG